MNAKWYLFPASGRHLKSLVWYTSLLKIWSSETHNYPSTLSRSDHWCLENCMRQRNKHKNTKLTSMSGSFVSYVSLKLFILKMTSLNHLTECCLISSTFTCLYTCLCTHLAFSFYHYLKMQSFILFTRIRLIFGINYCILIFIQSKTSF